MSDRIVIIIVCFLLLVAMCALFVTAVWWVPAKMKRLDDRLARLDEINAQIQLLHDRMAELDELKKKLSDTASASAPLARVGDEIDALSQKVSTATAIAELKDRMVAKSDLDKLSGALAGISQKIDAIGSANKADPEVAKLEKQVGDLKDQVESLRKLVDSMTRDISKDLKQLHLEIQKPR